MVWPRADETEISTAYWAHVALEGLYFYLSVILIAHELLRNAHLLVAGAAWRI